MKPRRTGPLAVLLMLSSFSACGSDDDSSVGTALDIRYEHPEADVSFDYRIECDADGGETSGAVAEAGVDAPSACDALERPEVVERLTEGPDDEVCTQIYGGPDIVEVTGEIDGTMVDTSVDRTNGCGINDWDELLGDLLPPAIGVVSP